MGETETNQRNQPKDRPTRIRTRTRTAATRTNTTMMAAKVKSKKAKRKQRHERQRRNIYGTEERPRLAVYKSNEHIYAQVIDESKNEGKGHTLCAVSTLTPS